MPNPAVPALPAEPPSDEDDNGVTGLDRAVAEIGRKMRAAGHTAAITDPAVVAAIRRRAELDDTTAWRRLLARLRREGDRP